MCGLSSTPAPKPTDEADSYKWHHRVYIRGVISFLSWVGEHRNFPQIIVFYNYNDQKGTPKLVCSHSIDFAGARSHRHCIMCSQTHRSHCRIVQFPPIVQKMPPIVQNSPYFDKNCLFFLIFPRFCKNYIQFCTNFPKFCKINPSILQKFPPRRMSPKNNFPGWAAHRGPLVTPLVYIAQC